MQKDPKNRQEFIIKKDYSSPAEIIGRIKKRYNEDDIDKNNASISGNSILA
jgi:hypothetical protein